MAAYNLHCSTCKKDYRKLMVVYKTTTCISCGKILERKNENKTSGTVKEVLDNGIMPRKVERLSNIEELIKERSREKEEPGIV